MKMDILLESLYKYYKEEENITKLLEVIEVNNKISLRITLIFVCAPKPANISSANTLLSTLTCMFSSPFSSLQDS